jgi:hypothetical protein
MVMNNLGLDRSNGPSKKCQNRSTMDRNIGVPLVRKYTNYCTLKLIKFWWKLDKKISKSLSCFARPEKLYCSLAKVLQPPNALKFLLVFITNNMDLASIPKVVGSIPTVARHIFQAYPVWIYTRSNITNIISSDLYIFFLFRKVYV